MDCSLLVSAREIGVRIALGAIPSDVLAQVIRQGSRPIVVGVALGLAGALALARVLEGMLFGVTASDLVTFVGAVASLGAVAVLACFVPALRASRITGIGGNINFA